MSVLATVVISCAGMARRLGMGRTKALIDILGRPLIHWQLALLPKGTDIRIVVGYQAQEVIDAVLAMRKDVTFVFNHEYMSTGTAASLSRGAQHGRETIISLDGDLIVHPEDFSRILQGSMNCLGCLPCSSTDPVFVRYKQVQEIVESFSRDSGDAEWSGLARVSKKLVMDSWRDGHGEGHVFEMIKPHLPMPATLIRAREIDTTADYTTALAWMNENKLSWTKPFESFSL